MRSTFRNYYHASTVKIKDFNINKGGLHLGGRYSALEAAARKVRELHSNDKKVAKIYLHSVLVDDSRLQETFDHGSGDAWQHSIDEWQKVGLPGARYKNEFEPDCRHSIVVCDKSVVKQIVKIEEISLDDAEDILEELENGYYF